MIEVKNLTKYYGDFLALDNLSFKVEKGKVLGFLGPNGAGKTTTMRIISCFMPPSSGTALLSNIDILQKPIEAKSIIGYLPETPPLYYDMRVNEYLRFVAEIKNVEDNLIEEHVQKAIDKCGLKEVVRKLCGALSKGYRQRVGIAQSLLNEPEVLILDEPTVGLDPKQIGEIRTLIKSLSGERTVILSTHILSEVTLVCDDILIINRGRMMFKDSMANVGKKTDLEKLFLQYTYEYDSMQESAAADSGSKSDAYQRQ